MQCFAGVEGFCLQWFRLYGESGDLNQSSPRKPRPIGHGAHPVQEARPHLAVLEWSQPRTFGRGRVTRCLLSLLSGWHGLRWVGGFDWSDAACFSLNRHLAALAGFGWLGWAKGELRGYTLHVLWLPQRTNDRYFLSEMTSDLSLGDMWRPRLMGGAFELARVVLDVQVRLAKQAELNISPWCKDLHGGRMLLERISDAEQLDVFKAFLRSAAARQQRSSGFPSCVLICCANQRPQEDMRRSKECIFLALGYQRRAFSRCFPIGM